MKPNSSLVRASVVNKIRDLAFATIVTEAYVHALPFGKLSNANESTLSEYSLNCCKALGGFKALESAISRCTEPEKRTLLKDISNVCNEAANAVAERVVNESSDRQDPRSMEELVGDAGFTKKEFAKFGSDVDSLDLDRIADIIKGKVIEVLKAEKENHQRVDAINGQIAEIVNKNNDEHKEALKDQKPEDETDVPVEGEPAQGQAETEEPEEDTSKDEMSDAKEAYLAKIGLKSCQIAHESFFSTLQAAAIENLIYTTDCESLNADHIEMGRLMKLTTESSLPCFHKEMTPMEALENVCSIKSAAVQEKAAQNMKSVMECATIESLCVYTMMEALHTMNIITVHSQDVRNAMESYVPMSVKVTREKKVCNAYLRNVRNQLATENYTGMNLPNCIRKMNELEKISHMLHACTESIDTSVLQIVDTKLEAVTAKKIALESCVPEHKAETYEMKRRKNSTIASCNRIATMAKQLGPTANEIVFEQVVNDPKSFDVRIICGNGHTVNTFATMESFSGNVEKDLRACITESNLNTKVMPDVYFTKADGKGSRILMK